MTRWRRGSAAAAAAAAAAGGGADELRLELLERAPQPRLGLELLVARNGGGRPSLEVLRNRLQLLLGGRHVLHVAIGPDLRQLVRQQE